jgi:hypothetical protein
MTFALLRSEECGYQQGQDFCEVKNSFLFIVKQVGIINVIFLERILGVVTTDDPYVYVVAKILQLSLFLFVLYPALLFCLLFGARGGRGGEGGSCSTRWETEVPFLMRGFCV